MHIFQVLKMPMTLSCSHCLRVNIQYVHFLPEYMPEYEIQFIIQRFQQTLTQKICTVKLVQGGTAWDRKYFPHWTNFRIIQNK
jgi:hypothetical protein